jgi:hypothetical protein
MNSRPLRVIAASQVSCREGNKLIASLSAQNVTLVYCVFCLIVPTNLHLYINVDFYKRQTKDVKERNQFSHLKWRLSHKTPKALLSVILKFRSNVVMEII